MAEPAKAVTALVPRKPLTPEEAKAKADKERHDIRMDGIHEGRRHAEHAHRHKMIAIGAGGLLMGIACGWIAGAYFFQQGVFAGGAVTDRVLQRLVTQPVEAAPALTVHDVTNYGDDRGVARGREPDSAPRR